MLFCVNTFLSTFLSTFERPKPTSFDLPISDPEVWRRSQGGGGEVQRGARVPDEEGDPSPQLVQQELGEERD